jgi:site-specific DNA-methyltransferase (adenine-specific)
MLTPYYRDDYATLFHGDALEIGEWLNADVLVTDPPYGIRATQRFGDGGNYRRRSEVPDAIVGDKDTAARDAVLDAWGPRPAVVFGSWRMPRPADTRAVLIWHKMGAAPGLTNAAFMSNHEEIYVIGAGDWVRTAPPLRSVITTTEARHTETRKSGHPTSKPVTLLEMLIERCPPGIIADPFAGTGSTLIAAKYLRRQTIGVEIDERYCEMTAHRLAQETLFAPPPITRAPVVSKRDAPLFELAADEQT